MDRKRRHIINFIAAILVAIICLVIVLLSLAIRTKLKEDFANSGTGDYTTPENPATPPDPTEQPNLPGEGIISEARFIDLQPTVNEWLKTVGSNTKIGLMIYDINNSRTAASYQADQVFNVASVYKLLFAYDGYRQIALGAAQGDEHYTNTAEKGDLTLYQCLDLIIRESYNGCADKLASEPTRVGRVDDLIRTLDMKNTSNHGLESTAADLTNLMRAYWRHTDLNQDLWNRLADSLLNQPPSQGSDGSIYDWRQGLPSGFTSQVQVYNKVGWDWNGHSWNIYADVAILDFVDSKHYYTMVVLSEGLSDYRKISQLGRMVEDAVTMQSAGVIK